MVDQNQLWSLLGETQRAFAPFYREACQKTMEDAGVSDSWFLLNLVRGSDPQPFTVERFHAMFPYTAQARQRTGLQDRADSQLIERVGANAYRLTDRGRETIESIFEVAHRCLGAVDPLSSDEMEQSNSLLYRLVEASLNAPEPDKKRAITSSRWTDPGAGAPGAVRTDQYLTDLVWFRDDAHIAAWTPHDVSGHAWEALTFIWRGEASTAAELAERLTVRGYSADGYAEALEELVGRGWVEATQAGYRMTDEGNAIRQDVENATDRCYFAPWACLTTTEMTQLSDLLTRLKSKLQELAERSAEGET